MQMIYRRRWGRTASETFELKMAHRRDTLENSRQFSDSWSSVWRLEQRIFPLAIELKVLRKGESPGRMYAAMTGKISGEVGTPVAGQTSAKRLAAAEHVRSAVRFAWLALELNVRPDGFADNARRAGVPDAVIRLRNEEWFLRRAEVACAFAEGFLSALAAENAPRIAGAARGAKGRTLIGDATDEKVYAVAENWRHLSTSAAGEKIGQIIGKSARQVIRSLKAKYGDNFQIKK